jgi:nucleotide-binding universal stress UspA family protein
MAVAVVRRRAASPVTSGYRRIVVPLDGDRHAVDVACRLAAERRAVITGLVVIVVPPLLPLDARMPDEEAIARDAFARAEAVADGYGVTFRRRQVRARDMTGAVLDAIAEVDAELVVLRPPRRSRSGSNAAPFGRELLQLLRKAPCRVLVSASPV